MTYILTSNHTHTYTYTYTYTCTYVLTGDKLKLVSFIDNLVLASDAEKDYELSELKTELLESLQANNALKKEILRITDLLEKSYTKNKNMSDELEEKNESVKIAEKMLKEEISINKKYRNERASALMRDSIVTVEEYESWKRKEELSLSCVDVDNEVENEVENDNSNNAHTQDNNNQNKGENKNKNKNKMKNINSPSLSPTDNTHTLSTIIVIHC